MKAFLVSARLAFPQNSTLEKSGEVTLGFARVFWTVFRRLLILAILSLAFIGSSLTAIYLSRGKEVKVPTFIGKKQSDVQRIAQNAGLIVNTIEVVDEEAPIGIVINQEPKAGMVVKQGYTIKVFLPSKTIEPSN